MEVPRSQMSTDGSVPPLDLHLHIADPEVVAELNRLPEGPERDAYAARALRIGVLALRSAGGAIDADAVRREGEQILTKLQMQLNGQQAFIHDRLEHVLREYFDPKSGRFAERIERLVAKDGELERVLRDQVGAEDSTMRKTLAAQLGPESPLMKVLSPTESEGLLHLMQDRLGTALGQQRERILEQFSLDNQDGALSRLVRELSDSHDNIAEKLEKSIGDVVGEFSLDKEDSALSKLVHRVDAAQKKISDEFSLDQESSALARMRRDMLAVIEKHGKDDQEFRQAVLAGLAEIRGRREERDAATRHGHDYEQDLFEQVQLRAQAAGDVAAATGNETGNIPNSKVGDIVVELGPDHAAAGARYVIEAKEKRGYGLPEARAEIEVARKNRGAQVGIFAFSRKTAPEGLAPFQRLGQDVYVIWDAADAGSDVWLDAAVEVAKALCARTAVEHEVQTAEFDQLERAILAVEKQAASLEEIATYSTTIEKANEKIQNRVRISQKKIRAQIADMTRLVADLREAEA